MVESSDGGRSSESSASSSSSAPWLPTREPGAPDSPACQARSRARARTSRRRSSAPARARTCSAEPLEQRHGQRVGLVAEPGDVPLRDLDPAGQLRAPGDQRRRAARHQRDAADGGPAGRRQRDQQQRRRPEEGVPVRPAASRAPDQHADDGRGERDADPRHRSANEDRGSGPSPRKRAALGTISAEADTRSASCQLSQSPTETPSAGGVMPRPRLLIR